jgi:predicted nucleic-acid-binding protein
LKALDTNVLARFFVDDPDDAQAAQQRPAAVTALSERAFVSVTVLLEFEWVMRGFYGFDRSAISQVLMALISIGHISIEDRGAVLASIEAFNRGVDFADALHLARASRTSAFVTFDHGFAKRAKQLAMAPPIELLR